MKKINIVHTVITVLIILAGIGCSAPKEFINNDPLQVSSAEQPVRNNDYTGYAYRPLLNGTDTWEDFKEKAMFSIRYNELRIIELKSYLKKYNQPDDSFYQAGIGSLSERNLSMQKRVDDFNKNKDNLPVFKLRFTHDMDILIRDLREFSVYNL